MYKKIILLGMVIVLMFSMLGCGNTVNVKDNKLISYRYSNGGGMEGRGRTEEIRIVGEEVYLICYEHDMWYEDDRVLEYKIDGEVLEEIEKIFRKYKMNRWNNKRFTGMFVNDGDSTSYYFGFEGYNTVSFTSQIYPEQYANKLKEISAVVEKYKAVAEIMPGLAVKEKTDEEWIEKDHPQNGSIEIEVYEYSRGRLHYRIMNGTGEEAGIVNALRVVSDTDGRVIAETGENDSVSVRANSSITDFIELSERLEAGTYTITIGEYSSRFEIR